MFALNCIDQKRVEQQASRALLRWTDPEPEEPAHGLFVRIAELLHFDNAERLAGHCGVEHGYPRPRDILMALRVLPLREADRLEKWTPIVESTAVSLAGETFRRADWSVAERRYCPTCLIESSHHRAWWDLKIIKRCPRHDQPLTNARPDGGWLSWKDTDFVRLSGELARRGSSAAPKSICSGTSFDGYVLGRLGAWPAATASWLDELSLADVSDVVRWIGRLTIGGWRPDAPVIGTQGFNDEHVLTEGYEVARAGEQAVVRLLSKIGSSCPDRIRTLQNSFGWLYQTLIAVNKREGAGQMLDLLRQAADALGVTGLRYRYQIANRLVFTRSDVATVARLPKGSVPNLARAAGLHRHAITDDSGRYCFNRAQLDLMLSTLANSFSRTDAARRVGVDQGSFDRLARAGMFGTVIKRCANDDRQDRFTMKALDAFVQQIVNRCHAMPEPPRPSARLVDLLQLTACPADEVVEQIRLHHIPLRTRWLNKTRRSSIEEVRVLLEDLPPELTLARRARSGKQIRPRAKGIGVVCRARVAGMLGVDTKRVDYLADRGVLQRATKCDGTPWRGNLDASCAENLAQRLIGLRDLALILDRSKSSVTEDAEAAGLFAKPAFGLTSDMLRSCQLVPWNLAIRTFERDRWRFMRANFWRLLDWHLHRRQSSFMRKRLISCDGAEFWTTSRRTPVRVTYGTEYLFEFVCRISPRYDAHAYLQEAENCAALYEAWPDIEIELDSRSGSFHLSAGFSEDAIDPDRDEAMLSLVRSTLECYDIIANYKKDQAALPLLPLQFLNIP